eukprot:CAMPEP_0168556676 /NCGR_PEP_ID=MMETSP0413-20121227/9011_1 /TAXON_ID=136452 /ORGANISM="Filamoeba nolandi, Strain NC-AS-23-1" /LENGTH=290 /DNA_ID=CAMNT_0008587641 /DNA_START=50 /DNA_END=923 /DNA_ORIENTATION=+
MSDKNTVYFSEQLASGGFGTVWKGYYQGQEVAIKVLEARSAHAKERFEREKEILRLLQETPQQQYFMQYICEGTTEYGSPFYVMPLCETSLHDFIQKKGRFTFDQATRLLSKIVLAFSYAHSYGFIHRDIKPANILISKTGIVIGDWGLAYYNDKKDLTFSLQMLGTQGYCAPELDKIKGANRDPRMDIYSLGQLYWNILKPTDRNKFAYYLYENMIADFEERWPTCDDVLEGISYIMEEAELLENNKRENSKQGNYDFCDYNNSKTINNAKNKQEKKLNKAPLDGFYSL